ncbi:MAG TPA: tetratricopeptide repeat protein [Ignavibacteria bacterium]|nr:tetratricopeptide repeat protein [Ignavibacteria bacterium]
MNFKSKINTLLLILTIIIFAFIALISGPELSYSQDSQKKITDKERSLGYFIDGKTMELQNNYIGAIENFREALKYEKSPGIYYALAEVYFKLGKPDKAQVEINKALKINPEDQNYLEALANIYIAKKEFLSAIDVYEKIIRLDTNYTYGLYSLARLYQEMKMPAKAIVIYEKITNKIGYDFDVLNKMYDIYIGYKDYPKAIETLESLQKLDPFNIMIKSILASLYLKNNEQDKARKVYEEIFVLNPDNKEVQTELVKIYFQQNENEMAFENFRKMLGKDSLGFWEKVQVGEVYFNISSQDESAKDIAKNIFTNLNEEYPDQWIPYYYLGVIDIINKNSAGYPSKFEKALQLADTSSEAFVNIGLAYIQQNDPENSLKTAELGIEKFPDDYRLYYIKGLALQNTGNNKDAITAFEKAIEINPEDLNSLSTLALAYNTEGNYKRSNEIYEIALKLDPQNPLLLNNYAYNLSERGEKLDEALEMAKIAVDRDPGNASYLDTIGWIYFKLGKYKSAKTNIEKSLEINPNSAVVLEHLGDIYNGMKDYSNAVKYWKLSLEKNPENSSLKEKINQLKIS